MARTEPRDEAHERAIIDLFESAEMCAVTLDRGGRIVDCNRYLAETTGWERDELIGRDYFPTFEPYRPPGAMEALLTRTAVRGPSTAFDGETVLHARDGARRLVAWCDVLVRDEQGRVVGMSSIGQDVTERSRAQTRLALQLQIARSLAAGGSVEQAAEGVFEAIADAFPITAGVLWLVEGGRLVQAASRPPGGAADGAVAGAALARGGLAWDGEGGLAWPAVRDGAVVAVLEVRGAPELATDPAVRGSLGGIGDQVAQFLHRLVAQIELRDLVAQQAALLRVAALVAREDGQDRIVAAVTEEVAGLFGAEHSSTVRYGDDGRGVIVGGWNVEPALMEQLGLVVTLDDGTAVAQVGRTGAPARVDDFGGLGGEQAAYLREQLGLRASIAAPIVLAGRVWGALSAGRTHDGAFPPGAEHRLAQFGELISQALANAEAARALAASRTRLVATADAERRRLERNLHDGAQQRLIGVALTLRMAEARVVRDPHEAAAMLGSAREELMESLNELREFARGVHPAVLSDHGLRAALPALASRCTVPVEVHVDESVDRLPEPVEVAAYFAVSEALANVAKYAQAGAVTVTASRGRNRLQVAVDDDGVGGADASRGSGLQGLVDRVEALGGRLSITSPAGKGTRLEVSLPVAPRGA